MNIKLDNYYQTSDLALASALSLTINLDSVDNCNTSKVIFIFKKSSDLNNILEKYWNKRLSVEPISYFNQIKYLKSYIYGGKNG